MATMFKSFWILAFALLITACGTSGGSNPPPVVDGDFAEVEDFAYNQTGDIRVYYYIKPGEAIGARSQGVSRQSRQLHILINRSHSMYVGEPESRMLPGERFMYNADIYDLLMVMRDELGFFDRGMAVNIGSQDPIERADRERDTSRMIAVEQIKDGNVNTSYFAISFEEESRRRFERFEKTQELIIHVIGTALPRGQAGHGSGEHGTIGRRER
jgi:hypothetical protein